MKKLILLLLAICPATNALFSSNLTTERKPIPFQTSVIKSLADPLGYKNLPVSMAIMIKDDSAKVVYSETQDLTLNELAEVKTNIGTGANQMPAYNSADLRKAQKICYTITVHDPGGDVVFTGEDLIGSTPNSVNAEVAENANAIGNVEWTKDKVEPMELYVPPADVTFCIPVVKKRPLITLEKPAFKQLLVRDYLRSRTRPSAVNALPIDYLQIGAGNPCPLTFGYGDINEIENFYTLYPGPMDKYYNAFAVEVPAQRGAIGHASAAIYGEHTQDAQGVAVYANGALRGSYNQGRTGAFGICNNTTGNGAGLWGYVAYDAATGNGNYALLASANGKANSYAAYMDGDMYISGNTMGPSDRNLKTDIHISSLGLSALLKLRPAQYRYKENTNLSLPAGEHYGFIAQELEEIIPAVVHDIHVPANMDPDLMSENGTTTIKGINYIELIPVLTKAIQELNDKVDAQAAEITRLSSELKACKPK